MIGAVGFVVGSLRENTCFAIARSYELGAWSSARGSGRAERRRQWADAFGCIVTAQSYEEAGTRDAFDCSVVASWGELTSSKLRAQSYEEAGTRARLPTTDY